MSTHSAGRWAAVKAGCKLVHFSLDACPLSCYFSGNVATLRDTLSTSRSVGRGTGLSYTPCLLMKTDLRLRLHATQAQPCFPAASNALALPGGNGIFTATPTERITHYTLLRKVVCQRGTLWKPQTTKQAEYLALSRCLILSLYLLSAASVSWSSCSSL